MHARIDLRKAIAAASGVGFDCLRDGGCELPPVRFRRIHSALRKSIRIGVVSRREIPEQGRIAGQQAFEGSQAGPVDHEEVVRYAAGAGTSRAER
jgi:hypothetical protein